MNRVVKHLGLWLVAPLLVIAAAAGAALYWLAATPSGARWVAAQLPESITFASLEGTLSRGLTIRDLEVRGDTAVNIETLEGSWDLWTLLGGQFTINKLGAAGVTVTIADKPDEDKPPSPWPSIHSPIPVNLGTLEVRAIRILTGGGEGEMETRIDAVTLAGILNPVQAHITTLEVKAPRGEADLRGRISTTYPYAMVLKGNWRTAGDPSYAGDLALNGPLTELRIKHQLLSPRQLASEGTVALPKQPETMAVALEDISINITNQWQDIDLKLNKLTHLTTSGSLLAKGSAAQLQLELNANTAVGEENFGEEPPASVLRELARNATLEAVGHTTPEKLTIGRLELLTGAGMAVASGTLGWTSGLHWQAEVTASDIDTSELTPAFPARFSTTLASDGRFEGETLRASVDIQKFAGRLRGKVLNADGLVTLTKNRDALRTRAESLRLAVGDNRVAIDGVLGSHSDLNWTIDAPDLSPLGDQFSGRIEGSGTLSGSVEAVDLNGTASAEQLRFPGWLIGDLQLEVSALENGNHRAVLNASRITGPNIDAGTVTVAATGSVADHQLNADFSDGANSLLLALAGGYREDSWSGKLRRLSADSAVAGNWHLEQPVALNLSAQAIDVGRFCISQNRSSLCGQFAKQGEAIKGEANLDGIDLAAFSRGLPPGAGAAGIVNGHLTLEGTVQKPVGNFSLETTGGTLTYSSGETRHEQPFRLTSQGNVDKQRVDGRADLSLAETGSLATEVSVNLTDKGLAGNFSGTIDSIAWLQGLTTAVREPEGSISLRGEIAGKLPSPVIDGNLKLADIAFTVPAAGVRFTDGSGTVDGDSRGNWRADLSIASRDNNRLAIEGSGSWPASADNPLALHLSGDNVLIADRPNTRVAISPDMDASWDGDLVALSGRLQVPRAKLLLRPRPKGITEVSPDAVVEPAQAEERSAIALKTDITLALGEDVHLEGYGLSTDLQGELRIQKKASAPPRGRGTLSLRDGVYEAYGQKLKVNRGLLLFQGPLDNPGLNIVAERKTPAATVGLEIGGTARNIRSRIFSDPDMPPTDALTILVTGKSLQDMNESDANRVANAATALGISQSDWITNRLQKALGVDVFSLQGGDTYTDSSLVVGEYLSPRLFISYIQNLFSAGGSFALEYQIGDRLGLKAESGETQSVDLLYQIEH